MSKGAKPIIHPPLPLLLNRVAADKHLTQEQLSERLDYSTGSISRLVQGKQNWKQDTLQEFAAKLDCPIIDLLPLDRIVATPSRPMSEGPTAEWLRLSDVDRRVALDLLRVHKVASERSA